MRFAASALTGLLAVSLFLAFTPAASANHTWATSMDPSLFVLPFGEPRLNLLAPCLAAITDPTLPIIPDVPDQTFPEDIAFFVAHGWSFVWRDAEGVSPPPEVRQAIMSQASTFELWIDDELQHSSMHAPVINIPETVIQLKLKTFVSEYHDGFSGPHTFMGRWFLDASFFGGDFGDQFLFLQCTMTVTFE